MFKLCILFGAYPLALYALFCPQHGGPASQKVMPHLAQKYLSVWAVFLAGRKFKASHN